MVIAAGSPFIACKGPAGPQGNPGEDGASIIWKGEAATHPANPQINWAYHNTADGKSYIWDGSWWQVLAQDGEIGPQGIKGDKGDAGADGVSIVWKGELDTPPPDAQENWAYFNTTNGNAYIYNGAVWEYLALRGADGDSGVSIVWKGTLSAAPANPELNWAYYNPNEKIAYIFNGTIWQILARDGHVSFSGERRHGNGPRTSVAVPGVIAVPVNTHIS